MALVETTQRFISFWKKSLIFFFSRANFLALSIRFCFLPSINFAVTVDPSESASCISNILFTWWSISPRDVCFSYRGSHSVPMNRPSFCLCPPPPAITILSMRRTWPETTSWRSTWPSGRSASSRWSGDRRWPWRLNRTSCWWSSTCPNSTRPSGALRGTTKVSLASWQQLWTISWGRFKRPLNSTVFCYLENQKIKLSFCLNLSSSCTITCRSEKFRLTFYYNHFL